MRNIVLTRSRNLQNYQFHHHHRAKDILRAGLRLLLRRLLLVVQVLTHFLLLLNDVELRTPPRLPPIGEEWERLGEALRNRCVAQNRPPPEFSNHIPGLENTVLKLSCDLSWQRMPDLDGVRVAMDLLGLEAAFEDRILHAIEAAAAVVVEAITLAERISCEILNF